MHFDDFIAQQILKTDDPAWRNSASRQPVRRLLRTLWRTLWRGARRVALGIDAFSSVRHGIEVPADHGARNRPPSVPCHCGSGVGRP